MRQHGARRCHTHRVDTDATAGLGGDSSPAAAEPDWLKEAKRLLHDSVTANEFAVTLPFSHWMAIWTVLFDRVSDEELSSGRQPDHPELHLFREARDVVGHALREDTLHKQRQERRY